MVWPECPARCGKIFCPGGQNCCNASCSLCAPPGGVCIDIGCIQTPVNSACERSSNDPCNADADCATGGCGGELCFNPKISPGVTDCQCKPPMGLGCGCVKNRCTWWK